MTVMESIDEPSGRKKRSRSASPHPPAVGPAPYSQRLKRLTGAISKAVACFPTVLSELTADYIIQRGEIVRFDSNLPSFPIETAALSCNNQTAALSYTGSWRFLFGERCFANDHGHKRARVATAPQSDGQVQPGGSVCRWAVHIDTIPVPAPGAPASVSVGIAPAELVFRRLSPLPVPPAPPAPLPLAAPIPPLPPAPPAPPAPPPPAPPIAPPPPGPLLTIRDLDELGWTIWSAQRMRKYHGTGSHGLSFMSAAVVTAPADAELKTSGGWMPLAYPLAPATALAPGVHAPPPPPMVVLIPPPFSRSGAIVELSVDLARRSLSFCIDGVDEGALFTDLPADVLTTAVPVVAVEGGATVSFLTPDASDDGSSDADVILAGLRPQQL